VKQACFLTHAYSAALANNTTDQFFSNKRDTQRMQPGIWLQYVYGTVQQSTVMVVYGVN
jgi:hypothetical protein